MRRFILFLAIAQMSLALGACADRDAPVAEASGPSEVATPAASDQPPATDRAAPPIVAPAGALPTLTMHKDPYCECCSLWASHVEGAGFPVTVVINEDMSAIKRSLGVPEGQVSCHTAQVESYFIEGHVPAADIKRLLAERPDARGLSAPGMPIGSPGMPGPPTPYTVYLIGKDGSSTPFSQHGH